MPTKTAPEWDQALSIIEQACVDHGESRGIEGVGANAALRAMARHWKDQRPEGSPLEIIASDIEDAISRMRTISDVITRKLHEAQIQARREAGTPIINVPGECHSDDRVFKVDLPDVSAWLAQADAKTIMGLAVRGWRNCEQADTIAEFYAKTNLEVRGMFDYINRAHEARRNAPGYEASIDAQAAMDWLKANRRDVWARVLCEDNDVHVIQVDDDDCRDLWFWHDDASGQKGDTGFETQDKAALDAVDVLCLGDDWLESDQKAALAQGWGLFSTPLMGGYHHYELQHVDENGTFQTENEAHVFVARQAKAGDALAAKALRFLAKNSPREYETVVSSDAQNAPKPPRG